MSRIAGVILAAGSSERLGQAKQLLTLGDSTVLGKTLAKARGTSLDPLLLVVGSRANDVLASVDTRGIVVVHNPDFALGQSTSVKAGVQSLPADIDAVVFLLGDQPLVEPEVIDLLAATRRGTGAAIIQPHYLDGRGNPVLIGREYFGELLQLHGDTGARPLLKQHSDTLQVVPVNFYRPQDIDTIEDYDRVLLAAQAQEQETV